MVRRCMYLLLAGALVLAVSGENFAPSCPPGVDLVNCFANPCQGAVCRAFPKAVCRPNFCGGCFAEFFVNGKKVDCSGGPVDDICSLPAEIGPCDAAIPRYFFNVKTGKCEKFSFGGCGGNANNFETLEECLKSCACKLPSDSGPCEAAIPRYFFNAKTRRCEKFIYGGCLGNANNFGSFEKCRATCGGLAPICKRQNPKCLRNAADSNACCKGLACCACGSPIVFEDTALERDVWGGVPLVGTCKPVCPRCPIGK